MARRNVYLEERPYKEALAQYLRRLEEHGGLQPAGTEKLPVGAARGRVTANPVYAIVSSPHYPAAAMDGVAVRAADTFGASETSPYLLRLGDQAVEVDTGDPLPAGCDAVIMIEDVHRVGEEAIEIIAPASPWQHVRSIGEDLVASEMILPARRQLTPFDLAALLAGGVTEVDVYLRPLVGLIPTGDELVEPGPELAAGQIPEFNTVMLVALVDEYGGLPRRYPPVPDDLQQLDAALARALEENDMVVINAGSSAGREDYTAELIRRRGEVYTHGVAIRPGKPVILGRIGNKPVLGIPGYPVSAALTFELFARPVILARQGLIPLPRPAVTARLGRKIYSGLGSEEFVRVRLGRVGSELVAAPLARGAGVITSLVRADGWVRVPQLVEGYAAGTQVSVELLRPLEEIEGQLLCTGSHDLALDVLDDHLRRHYPGEALASTHVGSIGGLLALQRGEAVLAGVHLLDPEDGSYNVSYARRYLDQPWVLVNLVYRQQGLMVPPGNPKGIRAIRDLARPDVQIVNRQAGAGTRVFLDYLLDQEGIRPDEVSGYHREEFTHLAVAAAVAGGTADCGMGILAAARALHLDFIPLGEERYDLCVPQEFLEDDRVQHLLEVMGRPDFQGEVEALGGYSLRDCGRVMGESP